MDVKDIDFDELDRAVNSAIEKNKPEVNDGLFVAPVAPVLPVTPVVPALDLKPLSTVPTPVMRPVVSRPATGRFMDVVHSSSNMRSTVTVPERSAPKSFSAPITFKPFTPSAPTPVTKIENDNNDLDIDKISDEIDRTLKINTNDSQDSPFLTDAKVEKRPLNAFAAEQNTDMPSLPVGPIKFSALGVDENELEKVDTPLPAELQSDLLSIEAGEVIKTEEVYVPENDNNDEAIDVEEVSPRDNPNNYEEDNQQAPVDANKIDAPLEPKPLDLTGNKSTNPLTPTSIHQQYTELPNTGDREIGAIYDTNSYHTPMPFAVKKKSGWMWIVWIVLLMVVSVGAGVAVYFFVLPQL